MLDPSVARAPVQVGAYARPEGHVSPQEAEGKKAPCREHVVAKLRYVRMELAEFR